MQYKCYIEQLYLLDPLPINRSIYLQEVRPQKQSTRSGKSKPENTLGKYCTCTMGIVDVRNLSKFPATATVAATFTLATVMLPQGECLAAYSAAALSPHRIHLGRVPDHLLPSQNN